MKPHWVTTALVAALAGAAGATLAHELLPDRGGDASPKQVTLVEPDVAAAPDLREELAQLERRLAALELRPVPTARAVAATPETASRDSALTLEAATNSPAAASAPLLQEHVEHALERIREEERFAREQEKEQKRVELLENQLAKLETALGLGTDQVNDMRALYEEQRQAKLDMQAMWEDGFDRELVGQAKNDMATRYHAELERILSPQQLETFQRMGESKQSRRSSNRADSARRDRANGK